jgi:hypothetical protein
MAPMARCVRVADVNARNHFPGNEVGHAIVRGAAMSQAFRFYESWLLKWLIALFGDLRHHESP